MPVNTVTESPRNGTAPQTRDLEVVDVPPDQKRDQQVERAQARDGPRQPSPPRAEVKRHEPRGRDQHTQQRNMCPPHRREEFSGRPDSHLPQFTQREGRCGGCGHGKEQIGPGGAVAPPHQKVDHRQREARRRDHGPDDGDPTHELSVPDSTGTGASRLLLRLRPNALTRELCGSGPPAADIVSGIPDTVPTEIPYALAG